MNINAENKLASYIDALRPIIYINHFDFCIVDNLLKRVGDNVSFIEYNNALGAIDFATKSPQMKLSILTAGSSQATLQSSISIKISSFSADAKKISYYPQAKKPPLTISNRSIGASRALTSLWSVECLRKREAMTRYTPLWSVLRISVSRRKKS